MHLYPILIFDVMNSKLLHNNRAKVSSLMISSLFHLTHHSNRMLIFPFLLSSLFFNLIHIYVPLFWSFLVLELFKSSCCISDLDPSCFFENLFLVKILLITNYDFLFFLWLRILPILSFDMTNKEDNTLTIILNEKNFFILTILLQNFKGGNWGYADRTISPPDRATEEAKYLNGAKPC